MNLNSSSQNNQSSHQIPCTQQTPSTQNEKKKSSFILNFSIEELYKSRDSLMNFVSEIGSLNRTFLRKDVVKHCNKMKLSPNSFLTVEKLEKMVKNRIDKMIKNRKIKQNWSLEDVFMLIWVISKYCDYHSHDSVEKSLTLKQWEFIAKLIPGTTAESCMFKWLSLRKNNLSDNFWSQKQSQLLKVIVKKEGDNNWNSVSKNLYYANTSPLKIYRCPKQCREHWNCYLNPKLKKGPWSNQEDMLLLKCVIRNNGLKKWAQMVKMFEGRTQNALKNRYTLLLDKSIKSNNSDNLISELQIIKNFLEQSYLEQFVGSSNIIEEKSKKRQRLQNRLNRKKMLPTPKQKNLRSSLKIQNKQTISIEDDLEQVMESEEQKEQQKLEEKQKQNIQQEDIIHQEQSFMKKEPQFNIIQEQVDSGQHLIHNNYLPIPKEQIKMMPLTKQIFESIKNSYYLCNFDYIACEVDAKGLKKFDFQL